MVIKKYVYVVINADGKPIAASLTEFDADVALRDYERYHCDHNSCKTYKVELVGDYDSKK